MKMWMLTAAAGCLLLTGAARAQSLTPGPGEMTVIATSDDDGVPAPRLTEAGPLRMQAQMAGQWSGTEGAQITVQLRLTNPTARPIVLDEVRADFKKGAKPTDATVYTDRKQRVTIGPGHTQSIWLGFDNPQRLERVSVDLALSFHGTDGRPVVQRAFLKGNSELRYYERLDKGFNGIMPVPRDAIGTYPITTGPLYRWPSPYDTQMQPPNRGIINIGL